MKMTKGLVSLAMIAGLMGMGVSMPSCPGQQAMQEQIDKLTQSNDIMSKKLSAQDNKIKAIESDMKKVQDLLVQASNVIKTQDDGLKALQASVNDMSTKLASIASKPAGGGKKKKR